MLAEILFALALFAVLAALGFVAYQWKKEQSTALNQFKPKLLQALKKSGLGKFSLSEFVQETGVANHIASKVALEIFNEFYCKALEDGVISESEAKKLALLQNSLEISDQDRQKIVQQTNISRYSERLDSAIDGNITNRLADDLAIMQDNLALSKTDVQKIAGKKWLKKYEEFLENAGKELLDGTSINELNTTPLTATPRIICLEDEKELSMRKKVGLTIYREYFTEAKQDGDFSVEEEAKLSEIQNFFQLDRTELSKYKSEIIRTKKLAEFRRGNLPSTQTDRLLEGGEICHWDEACQFLRKKKRRRKGTEYEENESFQGHLTVTSDRLVFTSHTLNFEFRPSKIMNMTLSRRGVLIQTSSNRGNGAYLVKDPEKFEAILFGLVQSHKYQLAGEFESEYSRHIPDLVKRKVWARDNGRCIKCEATDYLEFDHIIPHSKGGANTENNIQLLCRKCNQQKSDRI